MSQKERLELCSKCYNHRINANQEVICSLTEKVPDFEGECADFDTIESLEGEVEENDGVSGEEIIVELNEDDNNKLRIHQDFNYALFGGLLAALISALIWAVITVLTQYQIGYMAGGVGFLVGYSVRFFGAGIDKKFGFLGAFLALIGCLLGNLFSQIGFEAQGMSLGYLETLSFLDLGMIAEIIIETFQPIDLLFYGIAVSLGFKYAFRRVTIEMKSKIKSGEYDGFPSNQKLRKPLFIGSIVVLMLFFLKINEDASGHKTITYESGNKFSEGEFLNGKEHGKWTSWHDNGETASIGYYSNGIQDSLWQWFNEAGHLVAIGNYRKGLPHGIWLDYFDDGTIRDSGSYSEGRMNGLWKYWYENGNLALLSNFIRNLQQGIQTDYYESGQLKSVGKMDKGKMIGDWKMYYSTGRLAEEDEFINGDKLIIKNLWDLDGKQIVKNGNGFYKSYLETGEVLLSGNVENGIRVDIWSTFYKNGNLQTKGIYENDIYRILNCWDSNMKLIVKNGFGTYRSYYPDERAVFEKGKIKNGYRDKQDKKEGKQIMFEELGEIVKEEYYNNGELIEEEQ